MLQQACSWRGIGRVVGQQTSRSNTIPNPKTELTAIAFTTQGPDFILKLEIELTATCHARPHGQRLLWATNQHGYHVVGRYPWLNPDFRRAEHPDRAVRDVHHVQVTHGVCLVDRWNEARVKVRVEAGKTAYGRFLGCVCQHLYPACQEMLYHGIN